MAFGAFLEAVSIGLILPFIAVLRNTDLVLGFAPARKLLVLLGVNIHTPLQILVAVGLGLIGAFVLKSIYLIFLLRAQYRYIFAVYLRLSRRLLTGFLDAPYTFHLQRNSAELVKVTTESVHRFASGFLLSLMVLLGELVLVLAFSILLLFIRPMAMVAAVLIVGVPTALIYLAMQRRLSVSGRIADQSFGSVLQWIEQAINGIKETIVTGCAAFFIDRHDYYLGRYAESMRTLTFLSGIPRMLIDTLAVSAFIAIVLTVVAEGQDLQSILPLLTMFAVAAIRLMPSASRIASGLAQLRFHYAVIELIYKELKETEKYEFEPRNLTGADRVQPLPFQHSLVLEHVSYVFPSAVRPAVDDISLEIKKGDWVALIGPTGAGKTTLIDLILGLFDPTGGRILVDGHDLQAGIAGWQRNIGLVPQSIYLMDDTIRRNIAFGVPNEEIDDERVWQALRAAHVERLVRSLPGGLDAMVGERGDRLSGGERQRLGIARALYRDPEVLVIDEGTAHLDNETEASIGRTLTELRGKKTIIVIAHRLALVKHCDRIFIIEKGRLRVSGDYSELVSTNSAFRDHAGAAS